MLRSPREARTVPITLDVVANAEGEVVLRLMSDHAGSAEVTLPLTIQSPGPTGDKRDSPGTTLLALPIVLFGLASEGRRQRA